ncbi:MAG: GNAT family protein [Bdellovibrionota bacterium]
MILKIDSKLELRQIRKEDALEFFNLADKNRAYLRQWLGWLDLSKVPLDTEYFINSTLKLIADKVSLCFLIWNENKIAGIIDLREINTSNKNALIGYWVGEESRGQGLAKKATKAVVNYAFHELKLNRIEIRCATGNTASQAVPKSLNFKEEGILRENEWLYDHFVDHIVYSILAKEWNLKTEV